MKVKQVKSGTMVSLDMSVDFYRRIQELIMAYTSSVDADRIKEIVSKIQKAEALDPYESGLDTLLILTNVLEAKFAPLAEEVEVPDVPNLKV